ncbi:dnaK protein [Trichomonas vaginalis G3]|uniref:DnaK protein n=1 Tax=Trichomonas vaginalis (strain ATCC PRA-98 / G3) TaxID=412133 RepID=A2EPF1_TRIV3|nr:ATP binding [Trichomonas vaginalis G3]EAX86387.1 dnaK protein [Trichomonas vaginalis G3]EAY05459.1 dnaK protein [Trichomonas vaginalis G3]KAI5503563.1 ATP binding [Trichomonas vaginalis G3]|eukprot:XP_001299317.1 dnaK protein [Trichomonas vaginalis G3]
MSGEEDEIILGIDLGTTFSSIAYYDKNRQMVHLIEIDGNKSIPSVVYYGDPKLVGNQAYERAKIEPNLVIYDSKRLIGCKYQDVQEICKTMPFEIQPNADDDPEIIVNYKGNQKVLKPVEVSSQILAYLKSQAERRLRTKIKRAVITVPHAFKKIQTQFTKDAAEAAGLESVLLSEPESSVLYYKTKIDTDAKQNVIIYDFGGGTFDASLATIEGSEIKIRNTEGDPHLGGRNIDQALIEHFKGKIQEITGIDIFSQDHKKEYHIVKDEIIKAKKILGYGTPNVEIQLMFGKPGSINIRNVEFNQIVQPFIDRTINIIHKLIENFELDNSNTSILLVGGTSLIKLIHERLSLEFDYKIHCYEPLEAVAFGAAIKAYMLQTKKAKKSHKKNDEDPEPPKKDTKPEPKVIQENVPIPKDIKPHPPMSLASPISSNISEAESVKKLTVYNCLSKSIGVKVKGDMISKLAYKNTQLPITTKPKEYVNSEDNEELLQLQFYEGEGSTAASCELVSIYPIQIPPSAAKEYRFSVVLNISEESLITCTVKRTNSRNNEVLTFVVDNSLGNSPEQMIRMKSSVNEFSNQQNLSEDFNELMDSADKLTKRVTRDVRDRNDPLFKMKSELNDLMEDLENDDDRPIDQKFNLLTKKYNELKTEYEKRK